MEHKFYFNVNQLPLDCTNSIYLVEPPPKNVELTYDSAGSFISISPDLTFANFFRYYTEADCGVLDCSIKRGKCDVVLPHVRSTGNFISSSIEINTAGDQLGF